METEKILQNITKPFIMAGLYKDEKSVLTDIVLDYITRKIKQYDKTIRALKKKYGSDFNEFTLTIKNKATLDQEDDWMDWKSAIEMRQSWNNVQKMIINNE
ncbi:MAG: hypothetical protein JRD87_16770 [Deltaproteobacteria bacterium]|jgi:hypothetical protein|nr:hypothetical protein [Deltaproteobacteria bacterium]MBW2671487.1 hypothetical protein [Deltaproteobacteria bacterium]